MSSLDQLIEKLHSDDVNLHIQAAEELAGLGEEAQEAIPVLVQGCGSENEDVKNWCSAALEGVGAPAAEQINDLKAFASAANSDIAFWAITLLGRAKASEAIPVLNERLQDSSSPALQQRAAWALKKIESE